MKQIMLTPTVINDNPRCNQKIIFSFIKSDNNSTSDGRTSLKTKILMNHHLFSTRDKIGKGRNIKW
jgi:hypothetical protein